MDKKLIEKTIIKNIADFKVLLPKETVGAKIENVRFEYLKISNWALYECEFKNCEFINCTFEDCLFSELKIISDEYPDLYNETDFGYIKKALTTNKFNVDFDNCELVCGFTIDGYNNGLNSCTFTDCTMQDNTIKNSMFYMVTFNTCTLPEDVIQPCITEDDNINMIDLEHNVYIELYKFFNSNQLHHTNNSIQPTRIWNRLFCEVTRF